MDWKNTLQWFPIWLLLGGATFAQDSDNDGIPDAWETANYMNPDSSYDAAVDFDRDGLTSLQEYQLSLLGKGTGVKGKWSAILVDLSGMTSGSEDLAAKVIAINDEDDVLVNLEGRGSPGSVSSAWVRKGTDGTWKQLTTVNGSPATISGRDLNDNGQVVGEARAVGVNGGNSFGFIKDLKELPLNTDVTPWFSESDSVTPVRTITAINDWGDVMGRRADWTSFFQSGFYGDVSPPGAWSSTLFTAINNWGQALGIEYSDPNYGMGLWSHFLLSEGWASLIPFPGVFSEYDLPEFGGEEWELMGLQEISYNPSLINDWGEYAGRYSVTGGEEGEDGYEEIMSGYWYYDGLDHGASPAYRQLLPWNYKWQVIHALNNWPQMIVSGTRIAPYAPDPGEPQEYFPKETFLMVEPMRVPLSAIAPDPTVLTQSSFKLIDINNRSTILGSLYNKIYLLKLNQDADGDRIPDDWEEFYGMDPLDPSDARDDNDGDGFSNLSEYQFGGNPSDDQIGESVVDGELRDRLDTDADGLPDAWERKFFPSLTLAQVAVIDNDDYDWLTNGQEWQLGTDPTKRDTDEDGLSDSSEVNSYFTNPANPDTDGDGLVDGDERRIGTNALDPASTGAPPTFLNIAEKVTTSTYAGYQFWANWRYTGPEIHEGSPSCAEYASSHAAFAYPALSEDNPVTLLYPEGGMPEINPDKCTPASPYNTDGFLGGGIPWNTCGSLRSWKVRAERRTPHSDVATQTWLVMEEDISTGSIDEVRSFQLAIESGETKSNDTEEIHPPQGKRAKVSPISIKEVSFGGGGYHELKSDKGDRTYTAPHWVDANDDGKAVTDSMAGERNYPVAFTRNTKPQLSGKFKVTDLPVGQPLKIKADSPQGLQLPETAVTPDGEGLITLPLTLASGNLMDTIEFFAADGENAFQINWQLKIGDNAWVPIGATKHTVYVTMSAPIKTAALLMCETLFNIGCRNADGLGGDPQAAVDAIYQEFKDRDVQRVKTSSGALDGNPMKYWGDPSTAGFLTSNLLGSGDGRCGAWTRMFVDVLRAQGIDSDLTGFYAPSPPVHEIQADLSDAGYSGAFQMAPLMYVKNWTIGANPFNPVDNDGIAAQNHLNPQAFFGDHFVVKYDGKFYDPSYGSNVYATQLEWEDSALDAFGAFITISQGQARWVWKADAKGTVETVIQNITYENIDQ